MCTLLLLAFLSACSAQKKADNISIEMSEDIINNNFKSDEGKKRLLFSISDKWYLVIVQQEGQYEEYYLEVDSSGTKKSLIDEIKSPSVILDKAFDIKLYSKNYIDYTSDKEYELTQGNKTYFVLKNELNEKYGEFSLSVVIKPTPINKEVYNYLVTKLMRQISN